MPTLVLEDVPVEVYDHIQRQALAWNRSVAEEAIRVLRQGLGSVEAVPASGPRLPDPPFLGEEMSAPFDLPRPGVSVPVQPRDGGVRLPGPFPCPEEGG